MCNFITLLQSKQSPNKSDAGEYKASVKNKWGTDYTTFQLGWIINTFICMFGKNIKMFLKFIVIWPFLLPFRAFFDLTLLNVSHFLGVGDYWPRSKDKKSVKKGQESILKMLTFLWSSSILLVSLSLSRLSRSRLKMVSNSFKHDLVRMCGLTHLWASAWALW